MYITKVVSHEISGQSSVSSSHIATISLHELNVPRCGYAHIYKTKRLLLAHCVRKYVFGSLQHIKCFTTLRTPTLSHTLFSHAPCVTPHPMTGRLSVGASRVDRSLIDSTRFCRFARVLSTTRLLTAPCLWSIFDSSRIWRCRIYTRINRSFVNFS